MVHAIENIMLRSAGTIHFVGIGGIGMSGIAELLHNLGYAVQGSDSNESSNVIRLKFLGINVFIGHNSENLDNVNIVVKSTAIKDSNPEIIEAKARKIPIIKRSEMLAELMRLKFSIAVTGTHGKTTTTSLIASIFEAAGLNPTVINGGIINNKNTNAYLGKSDYLIAEADESDETFIRIPSTIGVITNIDPEHLDYYGSFDNVKIAYNKFIYNIPFYGFAVCCKDHHEVRRLIENINDKEVITYGIDSADVDVRAVKIKQNGYESSFDVILSDRMSSNIQYIKDINIPIAGRHNILNSLSAIAIAVKLDFPIDNIVNGFKLFDGIKRRFNKTGIVNNITIIDDYAHHPIEIIATILAARSIVKKEDGRVIAVHQPHRFTRLNDLFDDFVHCFKDADIVIISDIYPAGEPPIEGLSKEKLIDAIKKIYTDKEIYATESIEDLSEIIKKVALKHDLVLCMGAGSISKWAYELPNILELVVEK